MTAAHCLVGKVTSSVTVVVGEYDITTGSDSPFSKLYPVKSFIIHENYNPDLHHNDIALVITSQITFNYGVSPACLPFRYKLANIDGINLKALGWGTTFFGGAQSDVLMQVILGVVPQTQCSSQMGNIIPQQFCSYAAGKDSCQVCSIL